MVTVNGVFDGKHFVPDQLPEGILPNARVRLTIETESEQKLTGLAAIAAMAVKGGLPADFAAQHHHYIDGVPKR